jgi:hypothetical protein
MIFIVQIKKLFYLDIRQITAIFWFWTRKKVKKMRQPFHFIVVLLYKC